MVSILKSCAVDALSTTRIMSLQNLPHKLLRSYVDQLASVGLIEIVNDDGRRSVHTTPMGVVAVRCYRNAIALLRGQPGTCPFASVMSETPRFYW